MASALPFAAGTASALPYDRSIAARENVLYHDFVYLRHVLSEQLLPALNTILQEPHRRFERTTRQVPLELAHRIDPSGLVGMLSARTPFARPSTPSPTVAALATRFRGHVPLFVEQSEILTSLDTSENRFIKSFLNIIAGLIEAMRRAVAERKLAAAFTRSLLSDCQQLERSLLPIRRHSMWAEVGDMTHVPASSTVLQRRRGYREVYRHFARMRLASRVPISEELIRDLLETKNIALLYELWAFFSVVRHVQQLLGPSSRAGAPQTDAMQIRVPWDLQVEWSNEVRLYYNSWFSRPRPLPRRSYSVPLRPDIALELPSGLNAGWHLFDAKFKLKWLDSAPPGSAEVEDEDLERDKEERRGIYSRGDLYKSACISGRYTQCPVRFGCFIPERNTSTPMPGGPIQQVKISCVRLTE